MTKGDSMNGLLDPNELAQIFSRLTDEGWIFPVHYSAISNNGSMAFGRYMKPGEPGQLIASHCPSGEFVLPISMMIVDERGRAALIKWLPDAQPVILH